MSIKFSLMKHHEAVVISVDGQLTVGLLMIANYDKHSRVFEQIFMQFIAVKNQE